MTRVKTGIAELDEMLHGGFMQGDSVMVAGSAGTGKTTLALQYLVNGMKYGENGIYLTFEQLPDQIYRDAGNFGWDLRKLEEENRFRLILTSPGVLLESEGESILDEPIKEIRPRRIVIDSLSHMAMYVDDRHLRRETYRVLMYLKTKGLSSLSIWEAPQMMGQTVSLTELGLSFLVDCVILFRQVEVESTIRKAMAIIKMRGSEHDKRLREFEITSKGIVVAAPFTGYEGLMTGTPRKSGIEAISKGFASAFKKGK